MTEYEANQALFETCEHRHDTTNPDAAYRTPCRVCFRLNHTPPKAPTWWMSPALAITLGVLLGIALAL